MLGQLRAAGHLVSLVQDLEAARELLASGGFDQALLPATLLGSVLEQNALGRASDVEAWRRSVAGLVHDLHTLLKVLKRTVDELQREGVAGLGTFGSFDEIGRRISLLSAFLHELVLELNGSGEEVHVTTVDLEDVVEAAAVTVYHAASERQQRLVIDIDESVARIGADAAKLKRVLANLLEYAVQQTPSLGTVTVRASRELEECVIGVSDMGEGVAQSDLERLFGPPAGAVTVGAAVLARVKRMVEQQGGRVWVESQKGAGSTIFISLPACIRPEDEVHLGVFDSD